MFFLRLVVFGVFYRRLTGSLTGVRGMGVNQRSGSGAGSDNGVALAGAGFSIGMS